MICRKGQIQKMVQSKDCLVYYSLCLHMEEWHGTCVLSLIGFKKKVNKTNTEFFCWRNVELGWSCQGRNWIRWWLCLFSWWFLITIPSYSIAVKIVCCIQVRNITERNMGMAKKDTCSRLKILWFNAASIGVGFANLQVTNNSRHYIFQLPEFKGMSCLN